MFFILCLVCLLFCFVLLFDFWWCLVKSDYRFGVCVHLFLGWCEIVVAAILSFGCRTCLRSARFSMLPLCVPLCSLLWVFDSTVVVVLVQGTVIIALLQTDPNRIPRLSVSLVILSIIMLSWSIFGCPIVVPGSAQPSIDRRENTVEKTDCENHNNKSKQTKGNDHHIITFFAYQHDDNHETPASETWRPPAERPSFQSDTRGFGRRWRMTSPNAPSTFNIVKSSAKALHSSRLGGRLGDVWGAKCYRRSMLGQLVAFVDDVALLPC